MLIRNESTVNQFFEPKMTKWVNGSLYTPSLKS